MKDPKKLGKDLTLVAKILGHASSAVVGGYMGYQAAKGVDTSAEQALYAAPITVNILSHSVSKIINSTDENHNSPISESIAGSMEGVTYSALEIILSYGIGYALGKVL